MKKEKNLDNYISILTFLWFKWIRNHEKSNNQNLSFRQRRECGERCERIQKMRQKIIVRINKLFEEKLIV